MKPLKTLLITTIFFILCIGISTAQVTVESIDKLANNVVTDFNIVGLSVGVIKDGKVVLAKGYGNKSLKKGDAANGQTIFAIGSNSKAFTTAALAILEEEGKIKWDDKVKKHLPEFTMYNQYVEDNFTITDLITHRSGLGLGIGDLMVFPDGTNFTIEDILNSFQHFTPESPFRTKWDYDNLLYLVAGELIHQVSGMTWEDFIETRIFKPLGMNNSYSSLNRIKDKSNLSDAHNGDSGENRAIGHFGKMVNGAAGGIFSSAEDMNKWMLLHLNNGKYGDHLEKQLFSAANHSKMWKIHTVKDVESFPTYNSHFAGYGLAWELTDITGNLCASHTGGIPGMLSKVIMIPDQNLGIVVLTNTSGNGAYAFETITKELLDEYLNLKDTDWLSMMVTYKKMSGNNADKVTEDVWKTVETNKNSKIDYKKYTGIYQDNWFGKVEVYKKGKQLHFKAYRSANMKGPMSYYKDNTFAIKWDYQEMNADAFAIFQMDNNGNVIGLKMKGISPNIDFSFDFHDLDFKKIK